MCAKKPTANPIDEYIARFPTDVQKRLKQVRKTVRTNAPDAVETIRYGIPTLQLGGDLVHFAAFKSHIGFYPTPSAIVKFEAELRDYESAKGSIKFPLDQPMPLDLIAKMVRFRVQETLAKADAKKTAKKPPVRKK